MPLDQNLQQTVTRLGALAFQCMRAGFLCLKCENFKIKMSFMIWDEMIFFAKMGIICKSIFPSVVQAHKQPYSCDGRIKLIVCQIRHELSVTVHEISNSWKKNVRWRTLYCFFDPIFRIVKNRRSQQSTNLYTFFDPFFRIVKDGRAQQNTPNRFTSQKQTDNPKWLILSTYIIAKSKKKKKIRKSKNNSQNLKITGNFLITPRMY